MKKFKYSFFPFSFFLLSLILIFSCSEKPTYDNLFDPDVSINAPSDFTYSIPELYKIKLDWIDSYNNETGFQIDKKVNTDNWQEHYMILETDETSWIDTLAGINDTLQYRICAIFDENYSDFWVTEKINNIFPAPSNLNCTPINVNQIELEWTDNSIGEDGFIIEQKENEGSFIEIGNTSQNNYIVSNLSFDSDYIFRVKAFSGNNFSDYSNEFSINIKQSISPTNLQGNVSFDGIEIHWTDNSSFETGFIIQRKKEEEEYQTIHINSVNNTIYIDTTVEILKRYFYRVATQCGIQQSNWSNEIDLQFIQSNYTIVDCNGTGDYLTIQEGIDSAYNGDVVIAKEGTYYENINFNGKNITVASLFFVMQDTSYISQTIIDGSQNGNVVTFDSGENSTGVLIGFTVTNGSAYSGGGIYCDSSEPTLTNVTITGNSASFGGGIHCIDSSPTLTNVKITENNASTHCGGGIYCDNSSPSLENVTITGNSARIGGGIHFANSSPSLNNVTLIENNASKGGGIYCYYSDLTLSNVTITGNSATGTISGYGGGGIYCDNSSPSLENVTISGNSATGTYIDGGGICCYYSSPSLNSVTITGNSANDGGGGIHCYDSSPSLTNVTISENTASNSGGGIHCYYVSNPSLTNVTITGNTASNSGGGICCNINSLPSLLNCILWNDSPQEIYVSSGSVTATYSDIQGGWTGTGNIDSNPLFINSGNFHLQSGSPCIDAGNPSSQYNDPDGTRNDMGAYGGPGGDW